MKTVHKPAFLILPLLVALLIYPSPITVTPDASISATPTYDPLVEPPLPEQPTEYELGRNLYWHWCMTCHGDRGQGLTDEFRGIWEPDHQNCWGRGCHAGRPGDEGFPIPTVVPALVDDTHLGKFASVQDLADYLRATHPPQSPGILEDDNYHAIALFVFTMDGRQTVTISTTSTLVPSTTPTMVPAQNGSTGSFPTGVILLVVLLAAALVFWMSISHTLDWRGSPGKAARA